MKRGAKATGSAVAETTELFISGGLPALIYAWTRGPDASKAEEPALEDPPSLLAAVQGGNLRAFKQFLESGANVNQRDEYGWTPLIAAAAGGHPEFAQMLLSRGADVNARTIHGQTALEFAEQIKHGAIIQTLRAAGAVSSTPSERMLSTPEPGAALAAVPAPPMRKNEGSTIANDTPAQKRPDISPLSFKRSERPGDFAIIIGIEKYARVPSADFAERDAESAAHYLAALGIPDRNIISLNGPRATRAVLQGYFEEWLPKNIRKTSTLYVFFAGHGAPDPRTGQTYLIPWDGDPMFLRSTAYPLNQLFALLAQQKTDRTIVVLDACFSGAGGRSVLAKGARPLVTRTADPAPSSRLTVLSAASNDQIAGVLEQHGHGLFTYFFLRGLAEGKRTTRELFEYLKPKVQEEAHRQNREQDPVLLGADVKL